MEYGYLYLLMYIYYQECLLFAVQSFEQYITHTYTYLYIDTYILYTQYNNMLVAV